MNLVTILDRYINKQILILENDLFYIKKIVTTKRKLFKIIFFYRKQVQQMEKHLKKYEEHYPMDQYQSD